ncbi:unnamed protein product [Paramecium sonneborni]|uniref:Transmembrane protein n=1 Tax=Paramecium sonneborni TaxID=65129 RepID=A0A8S1K8S4_9CILI|nr:unnamed protein product [Paramecium sonneborni]
MGQLYSFVQDNKKMVGITAVAAIGATATIVYNKRKQNLSQSEIFKTPKQLDDEYFPAKRSAYYYDDREDTLYTKMTRTGKIDQIIDSINVNYIPNSECLEPQTIVDILQNTIELAGDEFIRMTMRNRAQRRQFRENSKLNQYRYQIIKYNQDLEELLEKSQAELLNRLDINKNIFEESMLVLMERGFFQQLYMLQASVKQKIKEKIPSKKDLSLKQIKEVIKFNIRILKEQPNPFKSIISFMINKQDQKDYIPNVISLLVQDFIYQKYKIEEEDQIRNISKPECMGDPEILQLLGEIEITMQDLMQNLGLGGIENIPDNFENFA